MAEVGTVYDAIPAVRTPTDILPATAKAAAKASTKLATRLSKGEKRNRKRLAVMRNSSLRP